MAVQTLERTALDRLNRILPNGEELHPDMSLPTELYLIAHDDDTGRAHINRDALQRGLAAAALLELWLTRRVRIGWHDNVRHGTLTRDPGRITVLDASPIGDRITDTALTLLAQSGGTLRLNDFITRFAETGLYQRVQADLVAAGIIHRTIHRRYWLLHTSAHLPTRRAYPVRARGRIRRMIDRYRAGVNTTDARALALTGLVTALTLTRYLYQDDTLTGPIHDWLRTLVQRLSDPTICDITHTVSDHKAAT